MLTGQGGPVPGGSLWGPRRLPGSPRGVQGRARGNAPGSPGESRGVQGSPGEPRGVQGSPGKPRGAHKVLKGPYKALKRPLRFFKGLIRSLKGGGREGRN